MRKMIVFRTSRSNTLEDERLYRGRPRMLEGGGQFLNFTQTMEKDRQTIHICIFPLQKQTELCQNNGNNIRNTEAAVRGRQYGPRPSIQPEKRSFEGRIDGFGPY